MTARTELTVNPVSAATATTTTTAPSAARRRRPVQAPRLSRAAYVTTAATAFVVLVAVWWLLTALGTVKPIFLPSPVAVLQSVLEQAANGQLWGDLGASVYRVMAGYLLAVVVALPLGVLMGALPRVEAALEPLMDFIRYMPVVAFVPLTIIWVGTGDGQKFLIIWLGTFFQLVLMVSDAVRTVPVSYQNLGATLGLSRLQILLRIVFLASAPRVWDALRICLGWAWTWVVVAELVAATTGMGYRITVGQRYLATDLIIGYVIVLGALGLIFDQIMRRAGQAIFRYERSAR